MALKFKCRILQEAKRNGLIPVRFRFNRDRFCFTHALQPDCDRLIFSVITDFL